jgi:opacity protein-like surface antigen
MLVTLVVLMATHVVEISVWASYYGLAGIETEKAGVFEFAFENYTALGYGDAVAGPGYRLIGPITSLNGLLLIGWSVALIFEVMRMAEVQVARKNSSRNATDA